MCIRDSDPHLDGKPYYRFKSIDGDSSFDGFWKNCVAGLQWKQIPMVFTEKQGNALNRLQYDADARIAVHGRQREQYTDVTGKVGKMVSAGLAGGAAGLLAGPVGAGVGAVGGMLLSGANSAQISDFDRQDYEDKRFKATQDFALSQSVVQPVVDFPYNSETIRDFLGNGFLVYRYYYTAFDEARIDKLLTMYGYRVTKALELSDFSTRSKFNYVKAHGVSLGGSYPKWLLDMASRQIEGGVRVWHVLPDTTYYSGGNV